MATQIPKTDQRGLYDADRASGGASLDGRARWASGLAGGAMMTAGLRNRSALGTLLALGGAWLLHRATSGRCEISEALGIGGAGAARESGKSPMASVSHGKGIKIETSIVIDRPAEQLYRFWRRFDNLPCFMRHLQSVELTGDGRSHWVARGPAGTSFEWDAEIYNEEEPELLAWRSLPGSDVNHAGSVHFEEAPGGGTEVRVVLNYEPPAGKLGAAVAKLLGEEPEQQIAADLQQLKQRIESGEIPLGGVELPGRTPEPTSVRV